MIFIEGHFYRYRKQFKEAIQTNLMVGDTYQFYVQKDFFPDPKMEFILRNALGEEFEMICSYEALDDSGIDEIFEEVPAPTWWNQSRSSAAE